MELSLLIQAALALLFVVGLIGLFSFIARRYGLGGAVGFPKKVQGARLSVSESLMLDPKRRLVLIKCDQKEHLVILAPDHETVLENVSPKAKTSGKKQ